MHADRDTTVWSAGIARRVSGRATSLWLGVGLAFAVLIGAWIALFVITTKHRVESVPVEKAMGAGNKR